MAADEFGEKTEQPTERRRTQAREKGNVARSVDLNMSGIMAAGVLGLLFFGRGLTEALAGLTRGYLSQSGWHRVDGPFVIQQAGGLVDFLARHVLPFLLWMMAAGVVVNIVQVGILLAPDVLHPKFSRMNPLEGVKRILSLRGVMKLVVSLGKMSILIAVGAGWIAWQLPHFVEFSSAEIPTIAREIGWSVLMLAILLTSALLVPAFMDFAFQKWKHEQDLRMTKQEIRDEMKEMEGDPLTRQRRREAHRKLAQARELQQVREADVVITNPTHIAIAIKYDPERMPAPMVVAKGMGEIAERIRRIAEEHNVPIIERKPLARALYRDVKVGQLVPIEMYAVFAEIMAYIYQLNGTAQRLRAARA